jgi:uncharacterized protein YdeI (YjbR/CyaY-like superfamily)
MDIMFFETPAELRAWLEAHHASETELWVGFHKKGTRKPSITWPESVDEALCFGWIDGLRKSIDADSYMIRFTPRKSRSTWSAINIKRVAELTELGRMRPAGLQAFEQRSADNSVIYSYEQRGLAEFDDTSEQQFRANQPAWEFFQQQSASYRKAAIWWVVSAKKAATRMSRLAVLIDDSQHGRRLKNLTPARRSSQ